MWTIWSKDWSYTPEKWDAFFREKLDYDRSKLFFTTIKMF